MGAKLLYRRLIDEMVRASREGQGQVGARRARRGLWNANAESDPDAMPDQHAMNGLLSKLSVSDREIIATMLEHEFTSGMHEALVIVHEAGIEPFNHAEEGTPFHDYFGRLTGWQWPPLESGSTEGGQ